MDITLMKEYSKEVYPNIESLSDAFSTKPYGFKEKIKWDGGEYLVFIREDKRGDFKTELVFRKLLTDKL